MALIDHGQVVFALAGNDDGTFWGTGDAGFTMRVGPNGEAWAAGKRGTILHHR